ncbi:Rab escort protein 1 [Linum perenne]
MVDYDQENKEVSKHLLKTKDGVDRLARYQSSIGRFANAYGPFMYPIYGQGELPQAFCRRSAVKGCIYVLRMGLVGLLVEKSSGSYKGIKLASGQELFSDKLVLDPAFTISSPGITPSDPPCKSLHLLTIQNVKSKVVRGICITKSSLKTDISNLLVLYPPRCKSNFFVFASILRRNYKHYQMLIHIFLFSCLLFLLALYPEQFTTVRVLQLSGNLAVCPLGMFVIYLSALCEDVAEGKKLLNGAMNCLLTSPDHSESSSALEEENVNETTSVEESKPRLLWSALYIQELQSTDQSDSIFSAPTPSEDLDYNSVLDATLEMYRTMYPDSDFFPETPPSENTEENSVENPES